MFTRLCATSFTYSLGHRLIWPFSVFVFERAFLQFIIQIMVCDFHALSKAQVMNRTRGGFAKILLKQQVASRTIVFSSFCSFLVELSYASFKVLHFEHLSSSGIFISNISSSSISNSNISLEHFQLSNNRPAT